jgi:predicted TIM-barrel fold metal-dependent hydrolase
MAYVQDRLIHDADGHFMETPDWLFKYADQKMRDRMGLLDLGTARPLEPGYFDKILARREDPVLRASDDAEFMNRKLYDALGAFASDHRAEAMDQLGFASQLMFPSFLLVPLYEADIQGDDVDYAYRLAEVNNRAMADFCSADPRLLSASYLSLRDFERAKKTASDLIASGTNAIMISCSAPQEHSPSHIDLDPVWAQIEEAGIPVVLHIGTSGQLVDPSIYVNGLPKPDSAHGEQEEINSVSIVVAPRAVMQTLSALIIDGVMDRFPKLKFGVIEQGAAWVPSWIRQLDAVHDAYFKFEDRLRSLALRPSEYVTRQVRVTPYSVDDVGWIIEQSSEEICMFSSDYPHKEGGRDPIKRFDNSIKHLPESAKQRFYCDNFVDMMGVGLTETLAAVATK